MNENQDKNNFDDEEGINCDPIAKKAAKFSAFIYLGLAITVVIVATVGIFSISYDYEESIPQVSFPEISIDIGTPSKPDSNTLNPINPKPDTPAGNEQSNVDADVSEPEQRVLYYAPVSGEIAKGYSMDALVFSETMGDYRVHRGIDILADIGSEVVCYTDGVVASIIDDYFYGTTVSVSHNDGSMTYYMNLDPALAEKITVGAELLAGEPIGKVGTTARCESKDAPHLHFEYHADGTSVDPESILP